MGSAGRRQKGSPPVASQRALHSTLTGANIRREIEHILEIILEEEKINRWLEYEPKKLHVGL